MDKGMYKTIIITVLITIILVIFIISIPKLQKSNIGIKDNGMNTVIQDDNIDENFVYSIYNNEDIETILRTLSIPEEFRETIFVNTYNYTMDYIYNVLYKGNNELNINEDVLKDFLKRLNKSMNNKYEVSNVTKMDVNEEYNFCNSITDEYINELPNDTFEDGYTRFIYRHSKDSIPKLSYKDIYNNIIVYIFETDYNKYYFQVIVGDRCIESIEVLNS